MLLSGKSSIPPPKIPPPVFPLSKDEKLKDIGHIMSIGNLILGVNSVTVSYLIHYDSLLQNVTYIITKYDSYFITKGDISLLQKVSRLSLKNATVLLHNATFITNYDSILIYLFIQIHLKIFCKIGFS